MKSGRRMLDLLPLALVVAFGVAGSTLSGEPAGRLVPARAWCTPSPARPLGCGEAGVDLMGLVSSAELRAVALAVVVSCIGFAMGTPFGAAAAMARGRFERGVERACDLVQAFPSFILALAVLSAVRTPSRVYIGVVFALTAWAPFARLALSQTRVLRDATFVEKDANGRTVNRCEGISFIGGCTDTNEFNFLAVKAMRGLGLVYLENQARV